MEKELLDRLAKTYAQDKDLARLEAASAGIPINQVAAHYGVQAALTGWELGKKHGIEEAGGKRGAPGAMKLLILRLLHGEGYVVGRQRALTKTGLHGGTRSGATVSGEVAKMLPNLVAKIS